MIETKAWNTKSCLKNTRLYCGKSLKLIESWTPAVLPGYKIQDEAYSKGLIVDVYIGYAKCMLFKVHPVILHSKFLCIN
jgi:hypothetical protein